MKSNTSPSAEQTGGSWTFLSNHAHVLVCLARDPTSRLRDVAQLVGITERAAHRIVTELEQAGIVLRTREGRRNRYQINPEAALRHPLENQRTVGGLLELLLGKAEVKRLQTKTNARTT